jgi:membrane-associated protease RseP (regulator of RpoE activity)
VGRTWPTLGLILALLAPAVSSSAADPWQLPLYHMFPSHRGRIGIEIQPMTPELREHMKAPRERGLLVTRVETGSAGERAGLQVGDVIVTADDEPLQEPFDLVRRTARVPAGAKMALSLVRDGKERTLKVAPDGEATPWMDPQQWGDWIEQGMQQGSQELRHQLEQLERRLEELERKIYKSSQGGQKS